MTARLHTPPPYSPPPATDLKSLHVDAAIIIADKPAGLLSVPGIGPEKAVCAQAILAQRHGDALTVHRLDMDTSGLMVFARSKQVQRQLSARFERRQVEKRYIAVVEGVVREDSGTIDLPIAKYSRQRPLRHTAPNGQQAITHWRVLSRSTETTRVELTPRTGRSHQLRLHMREIGHPILGDPFYGNQDLAPRLLLHASALSFPHPTEETGKEFKASPQF